MKEFPKGFEEAIGSITINFSLLEFTLQMAVIKLASINSSLTIRLLMGDSFWELLAKFDNILIYRLQERNLLTDERKEEITKFIEYLNKKRKRRNDIVHSLWKTNDGGKIISFKTLKETNERNEITESKPINLKDLQIFKEDILEAVQNLNIFKEKIIRLLESRSLINVIIQKIENEKNENDKKETGQEENP